MHLGLPHLIYSGPPIDDRQSLALLPAPLQEALSEINGSVAWRGVLHFRGACTSPDWHSLRSAHIGPLAFHELYPAVLPEDLVFAEEAFGDQFLLRGTEVFRLEAETGDLSPLAPSLDDFFQGVVRDPTPLLGYEPSRAVGHAGGEIEPGTLLMASPPFTLETGSNTRKIKPIPSMELRAWLADFAAQIRGLPDGAAIQLKVVD